MRNEKCEMTYNNNNIIIVTEKDANPKLLLFYYHLHSVQLIEFNVKISGQPKRRDGKCWMYQAI